MIDISRERGERKMKLNVGDKVIVHGGWTGDHIGTVEKITPTGLIKVEGKTYYEVSLFYCQTN